jgi:putative acetyltransferase
VIVRAEEKRDHVAVRAVNEAAFGSPAEARLVDVLRAQATPVLSFVAVDHDAIVGHILFSPVELPGHAALRLMGLAPMAVMPGRQREGIGSLLVEEGLRACRRLGTDAVVVMGHPDFYSRFGFATASWFGIRSVYDAPDEAFRLVELEPGRLRGAGGTVRYHSAFDDL